MRRIYWTLATFAAMYIVATIVGLITYVLISPLAMWLSVFTLMPIVSALLIYGYLQKMHFSCADSLQESLRLCLFWIGLSFTFDALTYIVIIPAIRHTASNWTFFRDQSPWIWLSYAVLIVSSLAGRFLYLRRSNA